MRSGGGASPETRESEAETSDNAPAASRPAVSASARLADSLPGFVRLNVAGIGSSILGALAAGSVFLPWVVALAKVGKELETYRFTLRTMAEEEWDDRTIWVFFAAVLLLGIASIASVVLPRLVVALTAAVGLAVTVLSQLYLLREFEEVAPELIQFGIRAELAPDRGAGVAAFSFLVILVLQLIPTLNRPLVSQRR